MKFRIDTESKELFVEEATWDELKRLDKTHNLSKYMIYGGISAKALEYEFFYSADKSTAGVTNETK